MLPTYKELLECLRRCHAALRLGSSINRQYEARREARLHLESADRSKQSSPKASLHDTIDAHVWATEYCRINPSADHGTMLGWFANSIMAGYDHAERKARAPALDA